ncbi:hypothetical protein L596_006189 [Steinernema carpocapsae]|uniref:Uncharacterized protein n=1 Tax=Steinernema carpocapsae TaxID=34508 RepID=A0A4U8V2T7_STECR|nr:hypothetical protein L596_006189 [Steinernema carpocapsae]
MVQRRIHLASYGLKWFDTSACMFRNHSEDSEAGSRESEQPSQALFRANTLLLVNTIEIASKPFFCTIGQCANVANYKGHDQRGSYSITFKYYILVKELQK